MNIFKLKLTREIKEEPVLFRIKDADFDGAKINAVSISGDDEKIFPAQVNGGMLLALLSLPAGEYELTAITYEGFVPVEIVVGDENKLDIKYNGKLFTSYVTNPELAKPYLGPVFADNGESYTRLDFETREHPHHRSVFFGVGDVSLEGKGEGEQKVDFWNEPLRHGIQRHEGIKNIKMNAASSSFTAASTWLSPDGSPMLDAECEYRFYPQSADCRYIDLSLTLTASYGSCLFGATKEAGPLGVRVADVLREERGGYIENSYGAVGEGECWGRSANWCVCGGELAGERVGVAVFDNEKNERFPTAWHVRSYGLFAANNLYFKGGLRINSGEALTYKYRLVFFKGTMQDVHIKDRYIETTIRR